jgi:hypothetical protein
VIDIKEYTLLLSKIHNLSIDSIKTEYEAGYTDAQTCLIVMDYNNKSISSEVYGYEEEPIELRLLFHELFYIVKTISLKEDSTINKLSFYHYPILLKFFPPPPSM